MVDHAKSCRMFGRIVFTACIITFLALHIFYLREISVKK